MKLLFAVRNTAGHAAEMGATSPSRPVFFIKPATSLQQGPDLALPRGLGRVEHELELAVRVNAELKAAGVDEAAAAIDAVAVVLDLTARDVQTELKEASLPWLAAKGFDGACVLGPWVAWGQGADALGDLALSLSVNGDERQRFVVDAYAVAPSELVSAASHVVTLERGDLVACGTGAGVGPLWEGDELEARIDALPGSELKARVASGPQRS